MARVRSHSGPNERMWLRTLSLKELIDRNEAFEKQDSDAMRSPVRKAHGSGLRMLKRQDNREDGRTKNTQG